MVASSKKRLIKHIKLDFKETQAIKPTLDAIEELGVIGGNDGEKKFIFLNADILPGPAMRSRECIINADEFFKLCIDAKNLNVSNCLYNVAVYIFVSETYMQIVLAIPLFS